MDWKIRKLLIADKYKRYFKDISDIIFRYNFRDNSRKSFLEIISIGLIS